LGYIIRDATLCQSKVFRDAIRRLVFIALGQEGKEHLHLVTIMLDVADIVEDDTGELVELGQFLWQPQIALGGQQALHQGSGTGPVDRVAVPDELMAHRCQSMTFPDAWGPDRDHVRGLGQEGATLEPFELELQCWGESGQLSVLIFPVLALTLLRRRDPGPSSQSRSSRHGL